MQGLENDITNVSQKLWRRDMEALTDPSTSANAQYKNT